MPLRRATIASPLSALLLAACGGAPPPPPAPPPSAPAASSAPEEKPEDKPIAQLPSECEKKDDKACLPPVAFVKRLCGGIYPDVALSMFAKGTPWTRGYLRMNVEAWNASGGASSSDKLVFDEEVIVLVHREANPGGMVVSGSSGGYDVLRWDGSCASLMGEEITMRLPPAPKAARVTWRLLGDPIQQALLGDEKVAKAVSDRKKECKGATMGDVSVKCVKADAALSSVIVDYVRRGGPVPPPSKLP